jgi:flagellar motor protein MotB
MRQTLWLFLLSLIAFCFVVLFYLASQVSQPNELLSKAIDTATDDYSLTEEIADPVDIKDKNAFVKTQVYNQLRIALPEKKLQNMGVELFKDGTLRISNYGLITRKIPVKLQHKLSKILPSYFKILSQPHFSKHIKKIQIEAHTSSKWQNSNDTKYNYERNKVLSNQQARAVEKFIYELIELKHLHRWLGLALIPIGRSFQELIYTDEKENVKRSRRIEIRIIF